MTSKTLIIAAASTFTVAGVASANLYNGNGGSGFGGGVGGGVLEITDDGTDVTFNLTGAGIGDNVLVLYIDSQAGGFGDTSLFDDTADGGRTAASGFQDNDPATPDDDVRTLATFAPGFEADFALSISGPDGFGGGALFELVAGGGDGSFGFVDPFGGASGAGDDFSLTLPLSSFGASSFEFVGTLISQSGFRSDETFGASTSTVDAGGDGINPGFTGTTTFSESLSYPIPEPTSLGLLSLGGLALLRRRK